MHDTTDERLGLSTTLEELATRPGFERELELLAGLVTEILGAPELCVIADGQDLDSLSHPGAEELRVAPTVRLVARASGSGWRDPHGMYVPEPTRLPDDAEVRLLAVLGAMTAYAVRANAELEESRRREEELANAQQKLTEQNILLRELAVVDELTSLRNRRYFDRTMSYEVDRLRRYDRNLSLVMIDVDHFKRINDTRGHPIGDEVLKAVARLLEASVRKSDLAARYGGEEFGLVLPETELVGALQVAERVRTSVEGAEIEGMRITVSIGVATVSPAWSGDVQGLVRAADQALYKAKQAGRNRIVVADLTGGETP